jgi:hypothetical protein
MKLIYSAWLYVVNLFIKVKTGIRHWYKQEESFVEPAHEPELLYESRDKFPEVGVVNSYYIDKQTACLYTWDGKGYVLVSNVHAEMSKLPTVDKIASGGFKPGEIVVFTAGNRPRYKSHLAPYMLKEQIHYVSKELPEL